MFDFCVIQLRSTKTDSLTWNRFRTICPLSLRRASERRGIWASGCLGGANHPAEHPADSLIIADQFSIRGKPLGSNVAIACFRLNLRRLSMTMTVETVPCKRRG